MLYITNESIVLLTIRIILGMLFFFQGYDKLIRMGQSKVIESYKQELGAIKLPGFLIILSAHYTSFVELIGGAMLILGLFKKYVLVALGVDMIMVVFVFSLMQPLWDMKFVLPRILLWCILMVVPSSYDVLSADFLIRKFL